MVLEAQGRDTHAIRAVQPYLGDGRWDDTALLQRRDALVAADIGAADGVMICDGSGVPTPGAHAGGVARQYCGAVGKSANGQPGVLTAQASRHGATCIDRRLSVSQPWCSDHDAEKRRRGGVPADVQFQTEPALALALWRGGVARGAWPLRWVTADEHVGMTPDVLDGVAALDDLPPAWVALSDTERAFLAEVER